MLFKYGAAKLVDLAEGDGFKAARPFEAQTKAADT